MLKRWCDNVYSTSERKYETLNKIAARSSFVRHVGGQKHALQHGGQNYFLLISCLTFHSYAQMCCKRYHIIFSTFSLKFKCKICVQREVIHYFKNHIFWSRDHLRTYSFQENGAGLKSQMTIILFKIWPTNRFSKAKSCNFHFHKNDVTCLLVQMAYCYKTKRPAWRVRLLEDKSSLPLGWPIHLTINRLTVQLMSQQTQKLHCRTTVLVGWNKDRNRAKRKTKFSMLKYSL